MKYKVYVLTHDKNPVYVGQTSDINGRIKAHIKSGKIFNSHVIIEEFDFKESALISERSIIKYLSIFKNASIVNGIYVSMEDYLIYK